MSALKFLRLGVIFLSIHIVYSIKIATLSLNNGFEIDLASSERGLDLYLTSDGVKEKVGFFKQELTQNYVRTVTNEEISLKFEDSNLILRPRVANDVNIVDISWTSHIQREMRTCYDFGHSHWFGGPEQSHQYWPIQNIVFKDYPYVTKSYDGSAVMEPYWLSSGGFFVYVHKNSPLFIDQNTIIKPGVCFIADAKPPYSLKRTYVSLNHTIGRNSNPRISHEHVVKEYFGKPTSYPDFRMTQHPIWSTWAKYKTLINESTVLEFANAIINNGFNNSQLEIDDLWETCYGSFNVDVQKFPDLKKLNNKLKDMGFRVTMWIHPFINQGCEPWYSEALEKGYFVKNEEGKVDITWWNSNGPNAAYIDFTNPNASKWWYDRLVDLQKRYDVDSFKFDAGESSWSPQIAVQTGDINEQPGHITTDYLKVCAKFGPFIEVRTAQRTQNLPIYVRMLDKDTKWTLENGLPTIITTLLQMNMVGYPFVLPDMIGGNGYNVAPSKELFIRWLQANTFMPSLQYSYVPWDYDNETIAISHKYTDLHAKYTDHIIEAFKDAVQYGKPVNPPVWWIDPTNFVAHGISDQYLLGENILVAPVVTEGARSRNIYLPKGLWLAEGQADRNYTGNQMLYDYPAPLDTLPYFIKV